MATKLLIVESPGKVKKLSQILGSDWLVKASMGHIRELANDGDDSLGFELDDNAVRCRFIARGSRGKETIQTLRSAVKQVKTVVLATDYDREGETIAWHIQQALNLKQPQRVVYTEITPAAVQAAVAQPRSLDMNLVHAGLCRTVLDKLVGYKGSPLLWQLHNGAKSMGRVQSATLHILCDRERQIQAFVPQDYWSVFVDYAEGFRAYYRRRPTKDSNSETPADDTANPTEAQTPESERVTSQADADRLVQIAQQHPHQVLTVDGKTINRTPPPPFITSSLQQAAGSRLRFSPEKTMQVAQSLYEAGLITYMRTDSVTLSPEFCTQARQWLTEHDPDNVPKKTSQHRRVKGAQEAHEAIRPTDVYRPSKELRVELAADAFALYVLIWKRAIASQCQSARLRQTRIVTQSDSIHWQAMGQVIEFAGYSKYWQNLRVDAELPRLQPGQTLTVQQAAHEQKQTQPPPRYSEPKLVQVMERKGIGRPSTYAPTIQTLKQRLYVEVQQSHLRPTPLGLEVDCFLQDALPDLLESDFTAQMEQALDHIADGQQNWETYLTTWNREYFVPALTQAKLAIPKHLTSQPPPSRTTTPRSHRKTKPKRSTLSHPTDHPCPICRKPMETYTYQKDGQSKQLLRCSDVAARGDRSHQDAVYFQTAKGWWSPKFGDLS